MKPFFQIELEFDLDLIKIRMGGFFDQANIAAFRYALSAKVDALQCSPNEHLTLCNVAEMDIQAQDIVAAFSKVVGDARFRSKRLAFVTGSTLARMQTQRLTHREGVAFFRDDVAAREWLLDPWERPSNHDSPSAALIDSGSRSLTNAPWYRDV